MSRDTGTRCGICGRFMSYPQMREAVITEGIPWMLALDPPDDVYNHKSCFDADRERLRKAHERDAQELPA